MRCLFCVKGFRTSYYLKCCIVSGKQDITQQGWTNCRVGSGNAIYYYFWFTACKRYYYSKHHAAAVKLDLEFASSVFKFSVVFESQIPNATSLQRDVCC